MTSDRPKTLGGSPDAVDICVTTQKGSLVPFQRPATFWRLTARNDNSSFIVCVCEREREKGGVK